jgi:1-acyl-sn-glycerol-3-phosphate acyltransferase
MVRKAVAALRSAVVVPVFFVFTIFLAGILTLCAMVRPDSPFVQALIRFWSHLFLAAAGARLTIEGQERVDPSGQYVFVANHLSNLDIPVMFLTAPVPIRYLAKKEVYKIPLVGTAMNQIGMVKVDRERGSAVHAEVNAGVAAARARGHSLIIFPEGTRSDSGELQPFKKGAFRIAVANQLTLVPVTIQGTWEVWPPGSKLYFPGRVRAVVHEPIPTAGLELSAIDEVRTRVHAVIGETYAELRAGTQS